MELTKPKRLLSIDVLRGFDMLLIAGGGTFIIRMKDKTGLPWVDWLADQFVHPAWNGFTFYDFIFPLFLFIAGVSLSFSLTSGLNKGTEKKALYKKVFIRMLILICLGIIYKNAPLNPFDVSQIRFGSVLGRIGIASFIAAVLYLNFSLTARALWIAGILLGYYAALFLIPVPGYGAGDLTFEGNLVGWIDRNFMPGRLLQKTYDELAVSTQLPAACLAIFGTIAGDILQNTKSIGIKIRNLSLIGIGAIMFGILWGFHFPINKHLWSSSFILLTTGMAFLFLTLFYWLIDVQGYRRGTFFFQVIGVNSLVIYYAYQFINFEYSSKMFFSGLYMHAPEPWQNVLQALGALLLVWLFMYFLFKNKIFVKI